MNIGGGEAADQLVRMMLTGTEVAVRLSGSALKNVLALSLALAKNHTLRRTLIKSISCYSALFDTTSRADGRHTDRRLATPTGLSPLRGSLRAGPAYAGQVYHYRLTGSWRNSLPELLWARWTRSAPFLPSLMQTSACTGGLRASAASLFPFRGTAS